MARRKPRVMLAVAACIWAAVMLWAGLAMLTSLRPLGLSGLSRVGAGLTLAAAGQFVFLVLVADRFFPHAHRRMVMAAEAVVFALFMVGLVSAAAGVLGSETGA